MKRKYCVDCMNFITKVFYNDTLPDELRGTKVEKKVLDTGRAVVFICRSKGECFLNGPRIYEKIACNQFDDWNARDEFSIILNVPKRKESHNGNIGWYDPGRQKEVRV